MLTETSWPCHIDPSTGRIYRDRDAFVAPQPDGSYICSHVHTDGTRHQWTTHNHPGSVGAAP